MFKVSFSQLLCLLKTKLISDAPPLLIDTVGIRKNFKSSQFYMKNFLQMGTFYFSVCSFIQYFMFFFFLPTGFSESFVRSYQKGFPEDWRELLYNHYKSAEYVWAMSLLSKAMSFQNQRSFPASFASLWKLFICLCCGCADFENTTLNSVPTFRLSAFQPWLFYSMLLSLYTCTVHTQYIVYT